MVSTFPVRAMWCRWRRFGGAGCENMTKLCGLFFLLPFFFSSTMATGESQNLAEAGSESFKVVKGDSVRFVCVETKSSQ